MQLFKSMDPNSALLAKFLLDVGNFSLRDFVELTQIADLAKREKFAKASELNLKKMVLKESTRFVYPITVSFDGFENFKAGIPFYSIIGAVFNSIIIYFPLGNIFLWKDSKNNYFSNKTPFENKFVFNESGSVLFGVVDNQYYYPSSLILSFLLGKLNLIFLKKSILEESLVEKLVFSFLEVCDSNVDGDIISVYW